MGVDALERRLEAMGARDDNGDSRHRVRDTID